MVDRGDQPKATSTDSAGQNVNLERPAHQGRPTQDRPRLCSLAGAGASTVADAAWAMGLIESSRSISRGRPKKKVCRWSVGRTSVATREACHNAYDPLASLAKHERPGERDTRREHFRPQSASAVASAPGGRCPSLADYVRGPGHPEGACRGSGLMLPTLPQQLRRARVVGPSHQRQWSSGSIQPGAFTSTQARTLEGAWTEARFRRIWPRGQLIAYLLPSHRKPAPSQPSYCVGPLMCCLVCGRAPSGLIAASRMAFLGAQTRAELQAHMPAWARRSGCASVSPP